MAKKTKIHKEYKGFYKGIYESIRYSLQHNLIHESTGYEAAKDMIANGIKKEFPDVKILKFHKNESCWVYRKIRHKDVLRRVKDLVHYHLNKTVHFIRIKNRLEKQA